MEMAGRNVLSNARSRMECTEDRGILHTMATSGITDTKRFLDRFTQVIEEKNLDISKHTFVHAYLAVN
jgi:hypothetical protein